MGEVSYDLKMMIEYTWIYLKSTQIKFWNTQFSCLILEKWYQINSQKKIGHKIDSSKIVAQKEEVDF